MKPGGGLPRINRGDGSTLMPADDAITSLVQAGRTGEAFDRLVPTYRRRVYGLAYSILGDRAAAEDLAQEVFVKLWQALPKYDGRAQLSTWIYAITRNASVSALRARRRTASMRRKKRWPPSSTGIGSTFRMARFTERMPRKYRMAPMPSSVNA